VTTTSDALRTESGVRVGVVLAIEGSPHLLCDAADVAPVITAWAGTGWTQARSGLKVQGHLREFCEPWAADINVPSISFEIQNEDFGRDVYKRKSTYRSQMTALFEADSDGEGTLNVKSTGSLPNEPGTIYLGNKAYEYSATDTATFTISQAEALPVFDADPGLHYSRPHAVSAQKGFNVGINTFVQTVPKTWIGRRAALYIHRIVGDVWDTRAEAQLEFAGRIARISDDPAALVTRLECEDMRAEIRDATILSGQWVGYVRSGVFLEAGETFQAREIENPGTTRASAVLTIVASGASGATQLNEGYYELGDIITKLNAWLAADGTLTFTWTVELAHGAGGRRVVVRVDSDGAVRPGFSLDASTRRLFAFLGFGDEFEFERDATRPIRLEERVEDDGDVVYREAGSAPFRAVPFQSVGRYADRGRIDFADDDGDFVDHTTWLPEPFASEVESGEVWSFFRVGDSLQFGKYDSANRRITELGKPLDFAGYAGPAIGPSDYRGLTIDDPADRLEVYQVVVLSGSMATLLTSLLASTGTGHNHATYDTFPSGMSCPGIPWSLLGDEWLTSVKALEQATQQDTMMVVLDKPRKLRDIIVPQLAIRFAWLTFADGTYKLVTLRKPVLLSPDHQLTEANKATASGDAASLISSMEETRDYLRNVLKVSYSRQLSGEYGLHITARDEPSISEHGMSDVRTIELPDTYADAAATGQSAEVLAAGLIQRSIPLFGKPLHLVQRTIAPTLYHVAVGDTVTIADNDLRHPVTGERGVDGAGVLAGIVLAVTRSPGLGHEGGELFGMVEVLVVDADRTMPIAPAAEVDTDFSDTIDGLSFTDGYASAGPALKLVDHAYSRSTDDVDASNFSAGDKIRIVEVDPDDPGSIDSWDRVIDTIDVEDGYITLTASISSPNWSGDQKLFAIVPQLYADVEPSQQLVSYLADDGDGLIQDIEQPNEYGLERWQSFAANDGTALPPLIATDRGNEGRPLDADLVAALIALVNNLVSHRAAPCAPEWFAGIAPQVSVTDYRVTQVFPFPTAGVVTGAARRTLVVGPILRTSDASATAFLRVTSSRFPPSGFTGARRWRGPRRSIEFSHTGDTDETAIASQELTIVAGDEPGITWITTELRISTAPRLARFRGFHTFYLGPVA
jgi:hypothetical protein